MQPRITRRLIPCLIAACTVLTYTNLQASECTMTTPHVVVPAWVNGDPLAAGSNYADHETIFQIPSDNSSGGTLLLTASEVGSIWGIAHDLPMGKLYLSAFLRRHAGLGPAGLGAIYIYNQHTGALESTPINVPNVGTIPTNSARGLSGSQIESHDPDAFNKVGKVGLGDIDIDTGNRILYAVNLNDRKIYSADLTAGTPTPTPLATDYPMPSCNEGEFRPFALNFSNDKLYLGGVCSGEAENSTNKQRQTNLSATVLVLDIATDSWSTALNFDLDYPRESPSWSSNEGWYPWVSDFDITNPSGFFWWPSPLLADIEFADDGHMILGFADRTAIQYGAYNYSVDTSSTDIYNVVSGGDILKATPSGSTFTIESNSFTSTNTPQTTDEFYTGEEYGEHYETSNGGMAVLSGTDQVVLGAIDPENLDSNGVIWLDTTDGTQTALRQLTGGSAEYGTKSAGIGDVEIISCPPPPAPDLELTKTVSNANPSRGDNVTYTITIMNGGNADASGVVAQDVLPAEVEYVSDNGGGAYDPTSGFWTIGSLTAGSTLILEIVTTIK